MKYYKYKRVSTQTQEKNGYGLDTQEQLINEYCAKNNIELSGSFEDAGISGATDDETLDLNRPGMIDLFNSLEKGAKIIVLNTSRLWRNDTSKVLIRHELKKLNADIISIEQPNYSIYNNDPNDFLMNGLLELLDQYDKMQITRKLAAGRSTKARQGSKACGLAPLGYRWEDKKIVVDWNNNLIVKDIFDMYALNHSLTETAKQASVKGYKTNSGNEFTKQAISNMIHNDFYIGVVTHAGNKTIGTHEPIIDSDTFESVQHF